MVLQKIYNNLDSDYKYLTGDSLFYLDGYFFLIKADKTLHIERYNEHDKYKEPLKITVRKFLDECILKGIHSLNVSNYIFAKYFQNIVSDVKLPVDFERIDTFNVSIKF